MALNLKGTGVAIITPFAEDRKVDFKSLQHLLEHLITGGVDYLVVQGTTGETATLTWEERVAILDFVKEINADRVPLILGVGGNNTNQVVKEIADFDLTGISAILSASPAYNKPTQEGIYQHYKAIAESSPLPIILYNVPGRTASNITADTTLRLANDYNNIVAIKEASNDLGQIMQIIKNKPDGFDVISGDDALTLAITALGGSGVISVVANAFPSEFSTMVNKTLTGDLEAAKELHYDLVDVIDMLFAEGNPGGVKAVLKVLGIINDTMRLPLVNISNELYEQIEAETKRITSRELIS